MELNLFDFVNLSDIKNLFYRNVLAKIESKSKQLLKQHI